MPPTPFLPNNFLVQEFFCAVFNIVLTKIIACVKYFLHRRYPFDGIICLRKVFFAA